MDKRPHLLVFISAHGFGHVAQTAPVLNALRRLVPELRITLRSEVPLAHLRTRIDGDFEYLREAGDIGMLMSSALDVRVEATADAYIAQHREWGLKVVNEADVLRKLAPDLVLSNVGYLPLAGAHLADIPCAAMCSLNWGDIHMHYCGGISGTHHVAEQILHSYGNADAFLRVTPGMPMTNLPNLVPIGPVADVGCSRRGEIDARLGLHAAHKLVLVSLGGVAGRLPIEHWPRIPGVRWLVPASWRATHPDVVVLESLEMAFGDVLASSDALICKPGYGSFVEAACSGVPVLYVSREDWPETPFLAEWLSAQGVCCEVDRETLEQGRIAQALEALWSLPKPLPVTPAGVTEAAAWLAGRLLRWR